MIFDEAAKKLHESQHKCYACEEKFNEKKIGMKKVCDHCHYTGKYRGALHSKGNLRLKRTRTIPVFFHNLTGYDCHLFLKLLADLPGEAAFPAMRKSTSPSTSKYWWTQVVLACHLTTESTRHPRSQEGPHELRGIGGEKIHA